MSESKSSLEIACEKCRKALGDANGLASNDKDAFLAHPGMISLLLIMAGNQEAQAQLIEITRNAVAATRQCEFTGKIPAGATLAFNKARSSYQIFSQQLPKVERLVEKNTSGTEESMHEIFTEAGNFVAEGLIHLETMNNIANRQERSV